MEWLAVAAGGAAGALVRALIFYLCVLYGRADFFILPTFLVNVAGSFLIGLAFGVFQGLPALPEPVKAALVPGFLGGFTTFSAFSLDLFRLLRTDRIWQALVYAPVAVICCVLFTWAGYMVATRLPGVQ